MAINRPDIEESALIAADGVVCTLSATHYLVDGSIGGSTEEIYTAKFSFDTGAGFNLIRRMALPPYWEILVDRRAIPPRFNDSNGRPLYLGESVWLNIRFENTLYRVKFIIASLIAVEVIIGTAFLNRHFLAILCIQQRIRYPQRRIPHRQTTLYARSR